MAENVTATSQFQQRVKAKMEKAQKRFIRLERDAKKLMNRQQLEKLATRASAQVKKKLDGLPGRLVNATGVKTRDNLRLLSREIDKLSKKVDGLLKAEPSQKA